MVQDVAGKVIEIIAKQAMVEPETVTPEATFEQLGLDSLGMVEVIFDVEETFDVSVPFRPGDALEGDVDLTTVGAVIRAVEGLVGADAPAGA